jgi:prephenate dehydratase
MKDQQRIAFQGEPGAYSQDVVLQVFGTQAIAVPYPSFRTVFQAVAAGEVDAGVVPVENSYVGRIAEVETLLHTSEVLVTGQIWHPIHHCLLGLPGQTLRQIKRVLSHPQALRQCDAYLHALGVELVAAEDTAGSARYLRELGEVDTAVIASARAATLYGLAILERGIETSRDNSTRFLVLRPSQMLVSEEDGLLCFPND